MDDKLSTQVTEQASQGVEDAHRVISSADCGFDGSPVRHTWPTMTWPNNNFLRTGLIQETLWNPTQPA